jgi:hypothetical protein
MRSIGAAATAAPLNVRLGSKADVTLLNFDVRFTPKSGHPTQGLVYSFNERRIVVGRS